MFRFTIRDALWLAVVVVVGAAVLMTRSGREHDRLAVMRRASEQELAAIGARYDAAKAEFYWHVKHWNSPGSARALEYSWLVNRSCGAIERFAYATEMSNGLETQISDLTRALELAQLVLSTMLQKNADDILAVHRTRYTLAGIEAQLRRAERDLKAAKATR